VAEELLSGVSTSLQHDQDASILEWPLLLPPGPTSLIPGSALRHRLDGCRNTGVWLFFSQARPAKSRL